MKKILTKKNSQEEDSSEEDSREEDSSEKKKIKMLEKDIKVLLQKKKKKDINIIWNVRRSYLTIEEIIILHIKSNYQLLGLFQRSQDNQIGSRINP